MSTISDPCTTADIVRVFGVTLMTVYNWRQGSARRSPLPCVTTPAGQRQRVVYSKAVVSEWAKVHAIPQLMPWDSNRVNRVTRRVLHKGATPATATA